MSGKAVKRLLTGAESFYLMDEDTNLISSEGQKNKR